MDTTMTKTEQLQQDLDYIAATVRRREQPVGIPALYLFWAAAVLVGFASADFAPRITGLYWFVVGIGGGLLSWWMGQRDARRSGVIDAELGRRHGLHWLMGGVAYFLTALPMFVHGASNDRAASFLLTTGIVYSLAGVHLERPLLWCGLLAFGGYAALVALSLPYAWTLSGVLIAACLVLAAVFAARVRAAEDAQREQAQ
jgi:hypothetical protein